MDFKLNRRIKPNRIQIRLSWLMGENKFKYLILAGTLSSVDNLEYT